MYTFLCYTNIEFTSLYALLFHERHVQEHNVMHYGNMMYINRVREQSKRFTTWMRRVGGVEILNTIIR